MSKKIAYIFGPITYLYVCNFIKWSISLTTGNKKANNIKSKEKTILSINSRIIIDEHLRIFEKHTFQIKHATWN